MPKYVLVVDDRQDEADITVVGLKKLCRGKFIAEALYGGQEFLDRLDKRPVPDLVLLDLDMPDINGIDILRALLKRNPRPAFKVLPSTGWGPGWKKHFDVSDIESLPAFKALVCEGIADKSKSIKALAEQVEKILEAEAP